MDTQPLGLQLFDRMERAVWKVRERLRRSVAALDAEGIPYAVTGGQAVRAWVATVDESALRNEPEIGLLVNADDVRAASTCLVADGWLCRRRDGHDFYFTDEADARPESSVALWVRKSVRLQPASAPIPPDGRYAWPMVDRAIRLGDISTLTLDALVAVELARHRAVNCMYVRDLIDVGLVDVTWPARLPPELAARLQTILDTPDG